MSETVKPSQEPVNPNEGVLVNPQTPLGDLPPTDNVTDHPTDPADVVAKPDKRRLSLPVRIGIATAAAAAVAASLFGAKEALSTDTPNPSPEPIPTASAPLTPGPEASTTATASAAPSAEVSPAGAVTLEALAASDNFVEDALLTPELTSLKATLAPEALAALTNEQLTATFKQVLETADNAPMAEKVQIFAIALEASAKAGLTLDELKTIPEGDYKAFIDYRVQRERAIMEAFGVSGEDYDKLTAQDTATTAEFFGRRFGLSGISLANAGAPYELNVSSSDLVADEATGQITFSLNFRETDREDASNTSIGFNEENKPVSATTTVTVTYSSFSDDARVTKFTQQVAQTY